MPHTQKIVLEPFFPMDTDVSFSPLGPGLAPSILIWDFGGYLFLQLCLCHLPQLFYAIELG